MNAVLHSATIAVFAHPGDLIVGRQRDRHGLGELGAEDRLRAVGDEGAISLVAGARLPMAHSRSAITACSSNTGNTHSARKVCS